MRKVFFIFKIDITLTYHIEVVFWTSSYKSSVSCMAIIFFLIMLPFISKLLEDPLNTLHSTLE